MTMGRMYLVSSIVSNKAFAVGTLISLFAAAVACAGAPKTRILTGTVMSDHRGPSGHAAGVIQLGFGARVHTLYYNEPLARHFSSDLCYDIGAIWSVRYYMSAHSVPDLWSVSCTGAVTEAVHGPWLVVREYLGSTSRLSPSAAKLLSQGWRESYRGREYLKLARSLDLSDYQSFGKKGTCIDVVRIQETDRAVLRAGGDCYLTLSGDHVSLVFTVAKNGSAGSWEIEGIEIEHPTTTTTGRAARLRREPLPLELNRLAKIVDRSTGRGVRAGLFESSAGAQRRGGRYASGTGRRAASGHGDVQLHAGDFGGADDGEDADHVAGAKRRIAERELRLHVRADLECQLRQHLGGPGRADRAEVRAVLPLHVRHAAAAGEALEVRLYDVPGRGGDEAGGRGGVRAGGGVDELVLRELSGGELQLHLVHGDADV